MTSTEAAGWLRERAESYSRDALVLQGVGNLADELIYRTVAYELRRCAEQLAGDTEDDFVLPNRAERLAWPAAITP